MKQTVVFDFDGVIHSYVSGWQGVGVISDPPVKDIDKALKDIHEHYKVCVVSTRCASLEGRVAMINWCVKHDIYQYIDEFCVEKPPAVVYIDDRAICFNGKPKTLLKKIQDFKPWYQKG